MKQKSIYVPSISAESWRELLADPEKHWKDGYSAKSAAKSWESQNGIPTEITSALSKNDNFKNIELLLAIPEFKVALPGGTRPSQNDVFFLAGSSKGLISCTVEAKATEDFDKLIQQWYNEPSDGKKIRLDFLLKEINFPVDYENGKLRYQFFHRLASSIIMAKKFHAKYAVLLIQSFVEDDKLNHYCDFESFIKAYKVEAKKEEPIFLTNVDGIEVYALWVNSKL